jgi:hypothetical protein
MSQPALISPKGSRPRLPDLEAAEARDACRPIGQTAALVANDLLARNDGFFEIAGLQRPNPLLYRSFPLTCARSQE